MNVKDAWLRPWHEVVGTLDCVETYEDRVVLRISSIRRIDLEIHLNELVKGGLDLVQLTGQKISVLRSDKDYILKLSKPNNNTGSKVP